MEKKFYVYLQGEQRTLVSLIHRLIKDIEKKYQGSYKKKEIERIKELTDSSYKNHKYSYIESEIEELKRRLIELKEGAYLMFVQVDCSTGYQIIKREL